MGFWFGNTAWISGKIGPAERLLGDRGQDRRHVEGLGRLGEAGDVVPQLRDVDGAGGEGHLRLVVDEHEHVVVGGEQALGRRGGFGRGGDAEAHRQQDGKGLENA